MNKGTLLALCALVLGLGGLWLWKERELTRGGPDLGEFPLCPGLSGERVRAVRIDHLQRGFQLKLERDAAGRWFLTDPVAYPAQGALVRSLLTSLEGARGEPVESGADLAQLDLDPPTVVLECVQVAEGGQGGETTLRVELGAPDLDTSLVYARVPGHPARSAPGGGEVFRTTRALVNTLERFPDDYREARATALAAQDVISIRRRGQVYLAEEKQLVDLEFDALLGPEGWKGVTRAAVSLDPTAMGLLARGATELAIERFVDDSPADLRPYGLDAPAFTVELEALAQPPVVLRFGHGHAEHEAPIGELTWFCQRAGFEHVWEVRARDVELLTRPAELFFDQLVVRLLRSDVARLELEGGGAKRVLEREKQGWSVFESRPPAPDSPHYPGNPEAIEEAFALLERVQLGDYLKGSAFEPGAPPTSFLLLLKNGARLGGVLGAPARNLASGAQGRQYLRYGDELVALIGDEVAELCLRPLDSFRSRKVHQLQESLVRAVELEHAGTTYTFVNTGDNVWNPAGQAIQAPQDFLQSLDPLLNLSAKRWLDEAPAHEIVLAVLVRPTQGDPLSFRFARTTDGAMVCLAEERVAEVDPAVVERLLKLFRP